MLKYFAAITNMVISQIHKHHNRELKVLAHFSAAHIFSRKAERFSYLKDFLRIRKLTKEGDETIIISRVKEFLHESLGLFLGQLLTKVGEETEKLVLKHGVVLVFVVELKDFNEVVESTLVLGVLASLVHGEDISLGEHLLALLGLSTDLLNSLEGWVEVASTDEVTSIEGINLAISLEVIDIEGEFDGIDFLLLESEFL